MLVASLAAGWSAKSLSEVLLEGFRFVTVVVTVSRRVAAMVGAKLCSIGGHDSSDCRVEL